MAVNIISIMDNQCMHVGGGSGGRGVTPMFSGFHPNIKSCM